ncbi:hypothetical protein [Curtobacterium sp. MCBD17_021]|uniref:hypothetical protein n=1 Tax=Curtobacterium sp. MCBD17_021 TaxID=2175665 RepID=UPI0015E89818|nr:hypothetical protein [Curtobacterium sp. MCBD17_021]
MCSSCIRAVIAHVRSARPGAPLDPGTLQEANRRCASADADFDALFDDPLP